MSDRFEIVKKETNIFEYNMAPENCSDCSAPLKTSFFQITHVLDMGVREESHHWDNVCPACVKNHAPGAFIDSGTWEHVRAL